jgi:sigma-B regulation protein RsbU (phosphoserine phosphatase)
MEQVGDGVNAITRIALVAKALTGSLRPSEIIEIVVRQGMAGLGADGGVLAFVTPAGDLIPVETVGYSEAAIAAFAPLRIEQHLPLADAARERKPVWLSSITEASERYPALAKGTLSDSRAWATIPLVADDAVIGVLGVSFLAARSFSDEERVFICTLADQCALALASVSRDRPSALSSAMFEHSLDPVMVTVPDGRILAANPAACRALGLPEREILRLGRAGLADPSDARWAAGLAERAATGRFFGELSMRRGDGTVFAAEVSSATFEDAAEEMRTIVVFRDLTARHPTTEEFQRLTSVVDVLRESFLPASLPQRPEFDVASRLTASDAGFTGDFYDLFDLGNGTWVLTMGDVAHHGHQVAAFALGTRYALHAAAVAGRSPGDVMRVANRALADAGRDDYCTAVYAHINPVDRAFHVRVARSGHPYPVLRRRSGTTQLLAPERSQPLGVLTAIEVAEELVVLDSGDAVVFYTDGLIERRLLDADESGIARLERAIAQADASSADSIADAVLAAFRMEDGSPLLDDTAVIVLLVR